jgi:hypothetical protein
VSRSGASDAGPSGRITTWAPRTEESACYTWSWRGYKTDRWVLLRRGPAGSDCCGGEGSAAEVTCRRARRGVDRLVGAMANDVDMVTRGRGAHAAAAREVLLDRPDWAAFVALLGPQYSEHDPAAHSSPCRLAAEEQVVPSYIQEKSISLAKKFKACFTMILSKELNF